MAKLEMETLSVIVTDIQVKTCTLHVTVGKEHKGKTTLTLRVLHLSSYDQL